MNAFNVGLPEDKWRHISTLSKKITFQCNILQSTKILPQHSILTLKYTTYTIIPPLYMCLYRDQWKIQFLKTFFKKLLITISVELTWSNTYWCLAITGPWNKDFITPKSSIWFPMATPMRCFGCENTCLLLNLKSRWWICTFWSFQSLSHKKL